MPELQTTARVRFASRGSSSYDVLLALFCVVLVVSNIAATKGVAFGPIIADGGAFLFPLAYVLGDVLAEVYGFAAARRAIIVGFAMALLAALTFLVVDIAPPASFYENQDAFNSVLGFVPLIVLASLCGYLEDSCPRHPVSAFRLAGNMFEDVPVSELPAVLAAHDFGQRRRVLRTLAHHQAPLPSQSPLERHLQQLIGKHGHLRQQGEMDRCRP